jgi:hypothetical protein
MTSKKKPQKSRSKGSKKKKDEKEKKKPKLSAKKQATKKQATKKQAAKKQTRAKQEKPKQEKPRREKPEPEAIAPQARGADDIPQEERAAHPGDDAEAKMEVNEGALPRAARAVDWRVANSLLALREQVNRRAPSRSKLSDGTIGDPRHRLRTSDHNPWVSDGRIGVVTAMDITHDPSRGCDAGALAEAIRSSRDSRVKYIIWNRRIANSSPIGSQAAWAWRPYSGANPHDKHVHISVKSEKASYDSTIDWTIG